MHAAQKITPKVPSRRPCIRGVDCKWSCCNPMSRSSVNRRSRSYEKITPTQKEPRKDVNQEDTDSDSGEDQVDQGHKEAYLLGRSSSGTALENTSEDWDSHDRLERSPSSITLEKLQERKFQESRNDQRHRNQTNTTHSRLQSRQEKVVSVPTVLSVLGIAVAIVVSIIWVRQPNKIEIDSALADFKREIGQIGKDYNIYSDNILQIQRGIETTLKNEDTSSILFLYRGTDVNLINEFVNRVAEVSAKYLRNNIDDASPIVVKNSDLNMETHKELVHKYRNDLEKQGIVMFSNLEEIPANLAMAFHYYCDEQEPLVKKTAVFFTLDLAKCKHSEIKTKHEEAEVCMMEKWRTLGKQRLLPLLARVVNIVVDLEGQLM